MGEPMARRLQAAGHALTVWNRSLAKAASLTEAGAALAASAADAARGADVVFAMLADDAALRMCLLGPDGALSAMSSGAVLVEMSTISPTLSAELAEDCARARYLPNCSSTERSRGGRQSSCFSLP